MTRINFDVDDIVALKFKQKVGNRNVSNYLRRYIENFVDDPDFILDREQEELLRSKKRIIELEKEKVIGRKDKLSLTMAQVEEELSKLDAEDQEIQQLLTDIELKRQQEEFCKLQKEKELELTKSNIEFNTIKANLGSLIE